MKKFSVYSFYYFFYVFNPIDSQMGSKLVLTASRPSFVKSFTVSSRFPAETLPGQLFRLLSCALWLRLVFHFEWCFQFSQRQTVVLFCTILRHPFTKRNVVECANFSFQSSSDYSFAGLEAIQSRVCGYVSDCFTTLTWSTPTSLATENCV